MKAKRIGVIGGGQLAWMMAGAAEALGLELVIQTPYSTDPAVAVAADTLLAPIDDAAATAKLAESCDIITFENEFINLGALMPLAEQGICFRPRLEALAPLLDKYRQRCYLKDIGLPQPEFRTLEGEIEKGKFELPLVLKARRHGYDGQGTFIVKDNSSLEKTWQKFKQKSILLEEFIPFERELAVIAARSLTGEVVVYPVVETQQEEQVCRRVFVPAEIESGVVAKCEAIARTLLNSLQAVGVFGIELFLTPTGKVLVNEVSPRTHNSGHFSLDACETSQFEMHLRAVAGLPLGNPALKSGSAVMVNLLGYEYSQDDYLEKRQQLASLPRTFVHWYGKTESRPGRKLGHVTVLSDSQSTSGSQAIAQKIESLWSG
ncbi:MULTISPECIES: 5-(carboxyamino)imidazole ribonucleotide synthase [unclassified Coleofasciculus]|uniref:5-(carboxyamino)imidazole ribonucleotide synthase n=1 Tax=unclassified Coleofasciculus TaxID=2692782 RepID=UPI00187E11E0|nr:MULTISPECIES: 5-(carboxyamino)imidazole ribonucleotide synthase [unclassified Coleofasciculus]MBE9125134.1 5-(carboxyamino)imidazole ribonucleotide synthase [Coleofasciculus sp. LEGE 07081]MBE9148351.1 5-(carboxyamino)imidazole ribonucleotide synthase [Coleofasciculus sp. LEGE 07092]